MKLGNSWIIFIASRFGAVDSTGRSALTSALSTAGIAFGVTALIVILSVMNGFQMGYIDAILEVSSYHLRLKGDIKNIEKAESLPGVRTVVPFSENQVLVQGKHSRQHGALLRALPTDVFEKDTIFANSFDILYGSFSLEHNGSIVVGNELARLLGVSVGDTLSVVAVSGSSDTNLFPENAELNVIGIVRTGYYEIDSTFAFVSHGTAKLLGNGYLELVGGIKLDDRNADSQFLTRIGEALPELSAESWREYNRSFFGALSVEKNMLMFLVILIFLVVTVNIYHGMRRSVYERREEISVLAALGASPREIQHIFVINGLGIGFFGALIGLLCGLFISAHINEVFVCAELLVNGINHFISACTWRKNNNAFSLFSPEYFYMEAIPVRIFFIEVLFVFVFGLFSATAASWIASRKITALKPAEVLRYE